MGEVDHASLASSDAGRVQLVEDIDISPPPKKDDLSVLPDSPDTRTVACRARARQSLEADVEAFLKAGGKIVTVEPGVTSLVFNQ